MATTTRVLDANVNGTVYTSNANDALEALDTCHSGATAPTDEVANGKLWLDTSTTPGVLKIYNNATWVAVVSSTTVDDAGGLLASNNLSDVASAATALSNLGLSATATEINVLDGITASTVELNTMDGITASTTELNYVDGVTSNIQTQIDSIPQPPELTQVQVEDDTSTVFGQVSGERLGQAVAANADSMTLLGTLTTTSGSSQVLSGLTLTPYKELHISWSGVNPTLNNTKLRLQGDEISGNTSSNTADTTSGFLIIELDYGNMVYGYKSKSSLTVSTEVAFLPGVSVSAATTSLTFDWDTGSNFKAGEIKVYGVK